MFAKTLKTVLLKTATTTGVKLGVPADRIGQGLGASPAYPMDSLSLGRNPAPVNPEPEPVRVQQASKPRMHQQSRTGKQAVPPTSLAGRPCFPGFTAVSFASRAVLRGWRRLTQTAAIGGTTASCLIASSHTRVPSDLGHPERFGRDCQSPSRIRDRAIAIVNASAAPTAKK
jgi:hypothetical protein